MQNEMIKTMIVTDQDAMRIHRANVEQELHRQWDAQIRAERIVIFLAGMVLATGLAVAVVVWR